MRKSVTLWAERQCMEETPLEAIPTFTPRPRQTNKRSAILILAIIIVVLLFLGYKVLSPGKTAAPKPTPTPVPVVTVIPTPTVNPSVTPNPSATPTVNPVDKDTGLDRSQLSVTVQNGSGTAGVAAKGVSFLKNLGYDVVLRATPTILITLM